jgi:hypothetical protein
MVTLISIPRSQVTWRYHSGDSNIRFHPVNLLVGKWHLLCPRFTHPVAGGCVLPGNSISGDVGCHRSVHLQLRVHNRLAVPMNTLIDRVSVTDLLRVNNRFQILCHSFSVTVTIGLPLFLLLTNNMESNGFGYVRGINNRVCSVRMDTSFIIFGLLIIAFYVAISIYTLR